MKSGIMFKLKHYYTLKIQKSKQKNIHLQIHNYRF